MSAGRSPTELFEPLTKIELSDQEWADIKREGDLQDLFRPAVETLFFRYAATRTARVSTRRKIQQLDDAMIKAARLINEIMADPVTRRDYLYIGNVGGHRPDLPLLLHARDVFTQVRQEVAKTNSRFDTANELLPPPQLGALEDFIYGLLFTQGMSRQVSPPTSFAENSHNPRFHRYIELCVSLAGPEEEKKSIDYALKKAVGEFHADRTNNPGRWVTNWDPSLRQQNR